MVLAVKEQEKEKAPELEIIKSDNWELPVINLGTGKYLWRPKTAFLPYTLFEGPPLTGREHGLKLYKDLIAGVHGPRGATKTTTVAYLGAKKLRMGQVVWSNFPISFYVMEPDCYDKCDELKRQVFCPYCKVGHKTYYENRPLNFDKLYTFNTELNGGAALITELQYYAEARTSGKQQNRFLTYQIMQIRKSAMSFFYDVQNPEWADKRFSWSDDIKIFCRDVSKMNYEFDREIEEGEYSHWRIRDISGVLTGEEYQYSHKEHGPYQFDSFEFWWIFPTKWKIDVYDAVEGIKKKDKDASLGKAIRLAIDYYLEQNAAKLKSHEPVRILASEMWETATILGGVKVDPVRGGKALAVYDIPKWQGSKGKWFYDISVCNIEAAPLITPTAEDMGDEV